MTAEHLSAPLMSPFVLSSTKLVPQTYYRSKLFIAPLTTNPLVAAAGPLLSLLERLCMTQSLPPLTTIRENIQHELQAFQSRLSSRPYTEELDAIAYYLLCATIDELIGKNYLRLYGIAAEFTAFTPSSSNNVGPEQCFFDILDYLKERPVQYLDLIELAYYCLITGFEGKHHGLPNGRATLDNLIEELYQLINQFRANQSYRLFNEKKPTPLSKKDYRALFASVLIAVITIVGTYFFTHVRLDHHAKLLKIEHILTTKLDN